MYPILQILTVRANECESFPVCCTIVRANGSKILSNNNHTTSSFTSTFTSISSATIECPSINFAKSLKTYKESQYHNGISETNDAMIIVRFDTKLFSKVCDEKSPAYDKNINLNALSNKLFKPGGNG